MKISKRGIELIKKFEGLRLKAYRCSAGVLTIGSVHTHGVKAGNVITGRQADEFLCEDLRTAGLVVNPHVKVPLSQGQFDALVSFVFNVGAGNFMCSTLLKKLNAKDYAGAADQFLQWKRAGTIVDLLLPRRKRERELFIT